MTVIPSRSLRSNVLKVLSLGMACVAPFLAGPSNAAAVVLPDPTDTFDGIPVAIQYDDFFSYSAKLLDTWGFAGFNGPTGTGGLDVILYTGPGGIDNSPVSGGFTFEDPAPAVSGATSSFSGVWGAGVQPNGPVLVDDVLAYLHNQFGPTVSVPIFTFDMAEPGNVADRDLKLVVKMSVYDPVGNTEVAFWALDALTNGTFDPAALVTAPGTISVTGLSSTTYTVNNNNGSGKMDFLIFAPTMDLSLYSGQGYEFHAALTMTDLQGAFEEAFLSGAVTAPQPPKEPIIPEPTSLLLFGAGLAGLVRARRRII